MVSSSSDIMQFSFSKIYCHLAWIHSCLLFRVVSLSSSARYSKHTIRMNRNGERVHCTAFCFSFDISSEFVSLLSAERRKLYTFCICSWYLFKIMKVSCVTESSCIKYPERTVSVSSLKILLLKTTSFRCSTTPDRICLRLISSVFCSDMTRMTVTTERALITHRLLWCLPLDMLSRIFLSPA